ncbi:hypothetical protein D9M68_549740 [compost metagenome]
MQAGQQGLEDLLVLRPAQVLGEGAVHLHEVDGQVLEGIEGVQGAAELAQGHLAMQLRQSLGQYLGLLQVGDGVRLAELEDQCVGWQPCRLQRDAEPGQQGLVLQAGAGEVDEQPGVVALGAVFGEQLDGVEDHPAVDLLGQAGFLGGVEEIGGRHFLALGAEQAQ